jgi:large subunit ribosomal protein L1
MTEKDKTKSKPVSPKKKDSKKAETPVRKKGTGKTAHKKLAQAPAQKESPAPRAEQEPKAPAKQQAQPPSKKAVPVGTKPEKQEQPSDASLISLVKHAKKQPKQRKFTQTWDLSVNLKGINLKKPENRFSVDALLPGGRGKEVKIAVIADSLAPAAEKAGADLVIRKQEIESLGRNKKKLKKIAASYDWFYGEATLMPMIAKAMGVVLGPRGKIPKPIPPKAKVEPFIQRARTSVRVAVKENPVIHVIVGSEKLDDEKVVANIESVYTLIKDRLPKGKNNIRSVYLKLTMGQPVKLDLK